MEAPDEAERYGRTVAPAKRAVLASSRVRQASVLRARVQEKEKWGES